MVWNGPLGYFELEAFARGTLKVGEALANMPDVFSVIGGGDTAAAFANQPWSERFSHISTGGGATLEYLEGIELPGVKALESRAEPRAVATRASKSESSRKSFNSRRERDAQEDARRKLEDESHAERGAPADPRDSGPRSNPKRPRSRAIVTCW